jgi:hypothetical protein
MLSCGFAQLKLLPSHLTGRTPALGLHHLPGKNALQAKRAPRAIARHILRPQHEQEPIHHDRHRHRALDTRGLFGDRMLAQAHAPLQRLKMQFDSASSQIHAHECTRRHCLRQMGHEEFCRFRPIVAPPFTQDHRDVSQMAPPCSFGIGPKGPAALTVDRTEQNLPESARRPIAP